MKRKADKAVVMLAYLVFLLISLLLMGTTYQFDNNGEGSQVVWPQQVDAAPAQPYACAVAHRGRVIYVDDNNDTSEAYLCFCGVDDDDSTYIWLKTEDPATDCF